jgi:diguanylate cyclase (GGDEF)-like protein
MAVLCLAVLAAVMAAIHATVYFMSKRDMEAQLKENAKGIAISVANCIMMDLVGFRGFLVSMDAGSDYYGKMHGYLASVKRGSLIGHLYVERGADNGSSGFLMDGELDHSAPGKQTELDELRRRETAGLKEAIRSTKTPLGYGPIRLGEWGEVMGALAPVLGEGGEVLGLVGVDIDESGIQSHLRRLNRTLLLTYLLIFALAYASLLEFSNMAIDRLFKDKLTGAYTKRYFDGLLNDEMLRSAKHGKGMSLLMLDLDYFKAVNDEYGHPFGDTVLAAVSEVLRHSIRPCDHFVRYGGDEFAIVMADVSPKNAMAAAERIRRAVEDTHIFNRERDSHISITVSIGVADHGNTPQSGQEMIESADRALYQAKVKRNMVVVYDSNAFP